ncbi:MAG: hypothetical protein M3Q37_06415, partial [Gemmatimonadota bacterium]|nr:hypothetical protein [Gemmatimonadota bacterium]
PMPVHLSVTRSDGQVQELTVPVSAWLGGEHRRTLRIAREPGIKSIEIDPTRDFPDVDRSNQAWPR